MTTDLSPEFGTRDVKIIEEVYQYRGFYDLLHYKLQHKLFKGGWSPVIERELLRHRGAIGLLPFDPVQDKVVLIEQFRMGCLDAGESPWLFEVVAGMMEAGESPEQVAKRECLEEATLPLLDLLPMHHYWSTPGGNSEQIWLFCGRVDVRNIQAFGGLAHDTEDIKTHVLSTKDAFAALASGQIKNAISIIALQWLQLNYDTVMQQWSGDRAR